MELGVNLCQSVKDLSYETGEDHVKLFSVILTNRFYIVNKSAQTTNLLYTLCVESFYVILCFLVQVCDLFRSKVGSVILEGLVIPFLQ